MPLFSFEGRSPVVDPTAFIAPTATLIGDVHVEAGASVWFNAVVRADFAPIIIREGANVQDEIRHQHPGRSEACCTHHRASPPTSDPAPPSRTVA
jgi:carbonic anhydrase/acetyltransferase-like protein (isoleucine patch superfamily)